MNQQELNKLLVNSYGQAPPPVQKFISSGALSNFIEQIRNKYQLHIDIAGRLSDEITMLMVGISDPKEFIQNLTNEALVPEASLKPIVDEINQKIFMPLREEIQKGGGAQPVKPPASPQPTPSGTRPSEARRPAGGGGPWPSRPQPAMPRPQVYAPPPQSPRYISAAESQLPAGMKFVTPSKEMAGIKRENVERGSTLTPRPAEARPLASEGGPPPPPSAPQAPVAPSETPLQQALRTVIARKPGDTDPYREPIE